MPNWCDNDLIITGKAADVKKCVDFIAGEDDGNPTCLDFEKIVPCPKELYDSEKAFYNDPLKKEALEKKQKEMLKKYKYPTAYDFHVGEWGTKWNACEPQISYKDGDTVAYFGFQTAWSPPTPIINALAKKFPELGFELKYLEFGMCFAGIYTYDGTDCFDNYIQDDIEAPLFQELASHFGYDEWLEEMKEEEEEEEAEKEHAETVAKFAEAMQAAEKEKKELENPASKIAVSKESLEQFRKEYMGE